MLTYQKHPQPLALFKSNFNTNMSYLTKPLIEIDDKTAKFLRDFNLGAGILHFIQGLLMIFLSNETTTQVLIGLPNPDIGAGSFSTTIGFENLFEFRLGPVVASFLLLSAIAHFLLVMPRINTWYRENLSRKRNYARWYEYALSSSIMICLIAILSGIADFNLLLLIFVSNALMNLFGLNIEKVNSLRQSIDPNAMTDWTEYVFAVIAGISPWIVVAIYFFTSIDRVDGQVVNGVTLQVPDFVKWIFWTLIVTFNTFAINMFLQYKKIGPWKNYLFGEKVYIIMSLTAKTILAWQVFGGTLR